MHPESFSMISEIAGLSDWIELMQDTIAKADISYERNANAVSNRTTSSLYHKLGGAYIQVRSYKSLLVLLCSRAYSSLMQRGYYQESIPYLLKSLKYDSQFLPSLKDITKAYYNTEQISLSQDYYEKIMERFENNEAIPDDIQELAHEINFANS